MSEGQPAYQRIADDIRAEITSGMLGVGQSLPSQQELEDRYGVARMTVRKAIALLINQGLVESRQGKGAVVRGRKPMIYRPQAEHEPRISDTMDRFMAAIEQEGRQPSQTIDVAVVTAPAIVADRLRLERDARVVVRKRVRFIDGDPFNINDTYYPYDLAINTEIMSPLDIPRGSNNILADYGYVEVRAIDEIFVRMPEPSETHRLDLPAGTPVACHVVTGYTDREQPILCDIFILPGDRTVIMGERFHPPADPQ